jgi:predicted  nucleic acid-binding Zn-ribbon protein
VDINDQVASLRQDVSAAQQQRASAEHGLAQAEARLGTAEQALQDEFGVDTPEAAEALASDMEAALEAEVSQARALLAKAGGQ